MKEAATTSTKAIAGALAGYVVSISIWLLTLVPGWALVPDEPKVAIVGLVSTVIGFAFVYFAPANLPVEADDKF